MKAELDDGLIRMMAGASREHARVQANLAAYIRRASRGSGCRPYGSDMAIRTHHQLVRYPDLTIDRGESSDAPDNLVLTNPRVVIEPLSPSMRVIDLTVKRDEYRAVASIDMVVFIDPDRQALSIHQRIEGGWTETLFSEALDLHVPSLDLTMPHAEIFARD